MSSDKQEKYKLVVLGAGAVGKSSITVRYISDNFRNEYDPTIEDYYRKLVEIDGEPALMDILDTAGQEEFLSMQDEFFRQGRGFLLVYSIVAKKTFEHCKDLREKIIRSRDETEDKIPMVLVGNKSDLKDKRDVKTKEGQQLAKEWGIPFIETSAKLGINKDEVFELLVREIRRIEGFSNAKNDNNCCIIL
mmetsp:Transcript_7693/g.9564  ORF Transcript_7693/g.9564 Transcript_7693/m.9564 type:complete len:191 (-) Transcript_7693:60-632(-)